MFLCAFFMCFIFEIQCIKQVAKLVVLPPVVMGYDDIDNYEFIISDEENTPDEIKRPVITNVKEVKKSPVTKTTTSNILLTTLLPYKNHEKYKTLITDKDTKISQPDSSADSGSNDDGDGNKSDDVLANFELLSSTLPVTKKKEELDKSPTSHEQDVTSQKELHVDSEETQKSDGIKSDDVIVKSELLSSTSTITKQKEVIDKSPPSHEQDVHVTSQEELHVDNKKIQEDDDIKSDDVLANSELITSTSSITKKKEKVVISPASHEQHIITSQGQVHVDKEGTLGDTKKVDKVQKEDPNDDEDHKKTLHSSESTESEKPVPVARNYLVNGFT